MFLEFATRKHTRKEHINRHPNRELLSSDHRITIYLYIYKYICRPWNFIKTIPKIQRRKKKEQRRGVVCCADVLIQDPPPASYLQSALQRSSGTKLYSPALRTLMFFWRLLLMVQKSGEPVEVCSFIPLFTRFISQVVQDFFHQQYEETGFGFWWAQVTIWCLTGHMIFTAA